MAVVSYDAWPTSDVLTRVFAPRLRIRNGPTRYLRRVAEASRW